MTDFTSVIEKIKKDENLKKQFSAAAKEDKVVEFLKGLGVETTKEEIASFLDSKKQEIKDSQLENVAAAGCGGNGCDATDFIVTIVCLIGGCYMGLTIINRVIEDNSSCISKVPSDDK